LLSQHQRHISEYLTSKSSNWGFFNEWVIVPFKSNDESKKFVRFETMEGGSEENESKKICKWDGGRKKMNKGGGRVSCEKEKEREEKKERQRGRARGIK